MAASLKRLGAPRDVLELRIAIRMPGPLARLAIYLQAVAQALQHFVHSLMTHRVTLPIQLGGQGATEAIALAVKQGIAPPGATFGHLLGKYVLGASSKKKGERWETNRVAA